jgi:hypothetical protein
LPKELHAVRAENALHHLSQPLRGQLVGNGVQPRLHRRADAEPVWLARLLRAKLRKGYIAAM